MSYKDQIDQRLRGIWARNANADYDAYKGTYKAMCDEIDSLNIYVGKKNRIKQMAKTGTQQILRACVYLCTLGGEEMAKRLLKEIDNGTL